MCGNQNQTNPSLIPILLLTFIIFSHTIGVNSEEGPLCFNCQRLTDPYSCTTLARCAKGFRCFSTHYWEPKSGNLYWDQSCKSDAFCSALPNQTHFRSDSARSTLHRQKISANFKKRQVATNDGILRFCNSCCNDYSDFCNLPPCDHTAAASASSQAATGLRCLSCNNAPDPANCTRTALCQPGQKCAVWTQSNSLVSMGCKDDSTCQTEGDHIVFGKRSALDQITAAYKSKGLSRPIEYTIKKRAVPGGGGCRACCNGDFCNALYCSKFNNLPNGVSTVSTTPQTSAGSTATIVVSSTKALSSPPTPTPTTQPLSVMLQPKQLSTFGGYNASFNCRVQGTPPLRVEFMLITAPPLNNTISVSHCTKLNVSRQEDVICSFLARDNETYKVQCIVQDSQKRAVDSAVLEVKQMTAPLSVDIRPTATDVVFGTDTHVYCRVEGSPKVAYTWIDSSTGMDIINSTYFGTYVTTNNTAVLHIKPNAPNLQKVFVCQASNAFDSIYLPFSVRTFTNITVVLGPQDTTLTDGSGTPARVTCQLESWPPANVSWLFETENSLVFPGNTSQINTTYHQGNLVSSEMDVPLDLVKQRNIIGVSCEAENGFATASASASIKLLVAAKIKTSSVSYTLQAGSNFSLDCDSEGSPAPQMAWTFTDKYGVPKILIGARVENKGASQSLSIDHIYDTGTFTCYAMNSLGTDTVTFNVTVI